MVSTASIVKILGVRSPVLSATALRRLVWSGLPKATLGHVTAYVVPDPQAAAALRDRLIPPATYKRRVATLKPEEGERVERLARVMAIAEDAFGSADDARQFLMTPHPELEGDRPLDAAQSELGARQVEEVLLADGIRPPSLSGLDGGTCRRSPRPLLPTTM